MFEGKVMEGRVTHGCCKVLKAALGVALSDARRVDGDCTGNVDELRTSVHVSRSLSRSKSSVPNMLTEAASWL